MWRSHQFIFSMAALPLLPFFYLFLGYQKGGFKKVIHNYRFYSKTLFNTTFQPLFSLSFSTRHRQAF
jgi:hypothetical protein